MSQPWATICIQVPTLEVQAPTHMRRKSRYSNALKVRRTVVSTTAVATWKYPSGTVTEWTYWRDEGECGLVTKQKIQTGRSFVALGYPSGGGRRQRWSRQGIMMLAIDILMHSEYFLTYAYNHTTFGRPVTEG